MVRQRSLGAPKWVAVRTERHASATADAGSSIACCPASAAGKPSGICGTVPSSGTSSVSLISCTVRKRFVLPVRAQESHAAPEHHAQDHSDRKRCLLVGMRGPQFPDVASSKNIDLIDAQFACGQNLRKLLLIAVARAIFRRWQVGSRYSEYCMRVARA